MNTSTRPPSPVAIITGGTRGIGRAIAERLYQAGYHVLVTHSSSPDDAQALELALAAQPSTARTSSPVYRALQIDVTAADAPARIFDAAEQLGTVVALINNAGITGGQGLLTDLTDDTLRRVLAVNLEAPVRLSREAARRWHNRTSRSDIIHITSVAARTGSPNEYVVYAATKGALETFTIGLARELAVSHIHVNAVSPGTIDTTIHARSGEPGRAQRVAQSVPLRRPGQATDIAHAVAWLLSDEASYVTGAVIPVTGGL